LYNGHRAIRIQEFDTNTDKAFGPRKMLINGGIHPEEKPIWIEGPHMYKINGQYFLMAAEGGTGPNHSEVILRGDSPMGKFVSWDKNPILTQRHLDPNRTNPITCAGHADLIKTKEGDWWAVFLACRPLDGKFENLGRETFLMPVKWSDDGFPVITQGDDLIPMVLHKKGVVRDSAVTFGNFGCNDNFDADTLGYAWITLRAPALDLYSLRESPGFLSLKCANVSASELKTPAFVCRRMQHHKFECTTRMFFEPSGEKEAAGLLLFKDETHQYFFSVGLSEGKRKVALSQISASGNKVMASKVIAPKDGGIQLKVVSNGLNYSFYYALNDKKWEMLCQDVSAHYLSTSNSFGFTGTTIGMYAEKK